MFHCITLFARALTALMDASNTPAVAMRACTRTLAASLFSAGAPARRHIPVARWALAQGSGSSSAQKPHGFVPQQHPTGGQARAFGSSQNSRPDARRSMIKRRSLSLTRTRLTRALIQVSHVVRSMQRNSVREKPAKWRRMACSTPCVTSADDLQGPHQAKTTSLL